MTRQHPMRSSLIAVALTALLTATWATPASATVLAKDSYNDYTPNVSIGGQTGSDSVGFSAAWTSGSANIQAETGGILDGSAASGQGKYLGAPNTVFRGANRTLDALVDPPDNTFYMSHLVNLGTSGEHEYSFVGFGSFVAEDTINGTANNLLGAFTGFVPNAAGDNIDLVVRSRTGIPAGSIGDVVLANDAAGITYNVVMALDYNNPTDQVRYWLNPTDFTNGEAGLTASSAVNGSVNGFQLSAVSDMNRLSVLTASRRSFFWDESILASSVGALVGIPEPTSALLAMLAMVGVSAGRRRA